MNLYSCQEVGRKIGPVEVIQADTSLHARQEYAKRFKCDAGNVMAKRIWAEAS